MTIAHRCEVTSTCTVSVRRGSNGTATSAGRRSSFLHVEGEGWKRMVLLKRGEQTVLENELEGRDEYTLNGLVFRAGDFKHRPGFNFH